MKESGSQWASTKDPAAAAVGTADLVLPLLPAGPRALEALVGPFNPHPSTAGEPSLLTGFTPDAIGTWNTPGLTGTAI